MGVQSLWKFISNLLGDQRQNAASANDLTSPEFLAIDIMGLLYTACNKYITECNPVENQENHVSTSDTFERFTYKISIDVLNAVKELVAEFSPRVLYIAFDGVPSMAKIQQQRLRRIREKTVIQFEDRIFTTAEFIPLSPVVEAACTLLQNHEWQVTRIIISPPTAPGEGEYKIISALYEYNIKHAVICGNDNDIIILGMLASMKREGVRVFYRTMEEVPRVTNLNVLANMLVEELRDLNIPPYEKLLNITFLLNFMGNDFVPQFLLCKDYPAPSTRLITTMLKHLKRTLFEKSNDLLDVSWDRVTELIQYAETQTKSFSDDSNSILQTEPELHGATTYPSYCKNVTSISEGMVVEMGQVLVLPVAIDWLIQARAVLLDYQRIVTNKPTNLATCPYYTFKYAPINLNYMGIASILLNGLDAADLPSVMLANSIIGYDERFYMGGMTSLYRYELKPRTESALNEKKIDEFDHLTKSAVDMFLGVSYSDKVMTREAHAAYVLPVSSGAVFNDAYETARSTLLENYPYIYPEKLDLDVFMLPSLEKDVLIKHTDFFTTKNTTVIEVKRSAQKPDMDDNLLR